MNIYRETIISGNNFRNFSDGTSCFKRVINRIILYYSFHSKNNEVLTLYVCQKSTRKPVLIYKPPQLRTKEESNSKQLADLVNKVNFLIAREMILYEMEGADFEKLTKEEKETYKRFCDVRNIFAHPRHFNESFNHQKLKPVLDELLDAIRRTKQ